MFYACVQRFDGMDEKILGGKLNRASVKKENDVVHPHMIYRQYFKSRVSKGKNLYLVQPLRKLVFLCLYNFTL